VGGDARVQPIVEKKVVVNEVETESSVQKEQMVPVQFPIAIQTDLGVVVDVKQDTFDGTVALVDQGDGVRVVSLDKMPKELVKTIKKAKLNADRSARIANRDQVKLAEESKKK
jgi:MoxR-like ATPase